MTARKDGAAKSGDLVKTPDGALELNSNTGFCEVKFIRYEIISQAKSHRLACHRACLDKSGNAGVHSLGSNWFVKLSVKL